MPLGSKVCDVLAFMMVVASVDAESNVFKVCRCRRFCIDASMSRSKDHLAMSVEVMQAVDSTLTAENDANGTSDWTLLLA